MTKKKKKIQSQGLNFDNMSWCIKNDFQVYVVPLSQKIGSQWSVTGQWKIAVRRGGISSEGKDLLKKNGNTFKSNESLSEKVFKSQKEAEQHLNYVYNHLRSKYG